MRKKVFSAMRPTGRLHLGHYYGALINWLEMQNEYDCYFGVADWHALTTNFDNPEDIKENTKQLIIDWLSVGIDIDKTTLFIQSHNKAHAELYLLLGMITPVSWLERNPSYKEIREEISHKELSNYGFLGYPVLQTADIILYDADYVPVGLDQVPHVEMAREIVRRFHALYNTKIFVEPDVKLTEITKLPGLDGRKMSKSYNNSILLSETEKGIETKVKSMITDTNRIRRTDKGNPEVCPVFDYHKVFTQSSTCIEIAKDCANAGIGCTDCKKILSNSIEQMIAPIRERRGRFEKEIQDIEEFLETPQNKARQKAEEVLDRARKVLKI